jgi:glutathione S-transferase
VTLRKIISRLAHVTTPVLYHIEVSHYNEKARWALDYKGVPHRRKAPMPIAHMAWAAAMTRGRGKTFPILRMNGDTIHDSTKIIERLERDYPEPPLYPSDPEDRRHALELEEFFDEELGPHIRRAAFAEVTRDPEAFAWVAAPRAGKLVHAGFKGTVAVAGPLTRMRYGINGETAAKGWEKTIAAIERLESEIRPSGYLVGDGFTVADLTAASLLFPLVRPPEAREALPPGVMPEPLVQLRAEQEGRPAFEWVQEMYRRHRGTSAAIA